MERAISLEVNNIFKKSLKTQLTLTIALVVALTVLVISITADFLVNERFKSYLKIQQEQKTEEIVTNLSRQYNSISGEWNTSLIHTVGMYFLYDGFIIKVYDNENGMIWDAEVHDMSLCNEVMSDIAQRMKTKYPGIDGQITQKEYPLEQNGLKVGTVSISYYGPFFLDENDFNFINAFNGIILSVGGFALIIAIGIGWVMAKKISKPITNAINITHQISEGNYDIRFTEVPKMAELKELITSIHQLEDSLKKQEELRKQLTTDVAHELRTPLATVGTHIEAMMEGIWEPTSERLQSCYEEIQRISKLVKELENLAKIESQTIKLKLSSVDLLSLVTTIAAGIEIEASNNDIVLTVSGDTSYANVDEDRMKQVIFNLLSNAIKYTKGPGQVVVEVKDLPEEVMISVEDNGVGISKEELPFIFERFYRADKSRNRKTGGAGIGLAIVKSLVQAHGGKIEVHSQIDLGSRFEVFIPKKCN
jgi:signal transduction histidine kinase